MISPSTPARSLAELRAIAEKATPGPWLYRPDELSDWGWVRSENRGLFLQARHPSSEVELADHRIRGTDPWANDAIHIATFDPPTVLALLARIEELEGALRTIAGGLEIRHRDGSTEVIDRDDAADIARTALGGSDG